MKRREKELERETKREKETQGDAGFRERDAGVADAGFASQE